MASQAISLGKSPRSQDQNEIEQLIEDGLEELRNAPFNDRITAALSFLTPPGYRPAVQIEQIRPKKRGEQRDWQWNPESARVVLHFEPLDPPNSSERVRNLVLDTMGSSSQPLTKHVPPTEAVPPSGWISYEQAREFAGDGRHDVTPLQIQQCCVALAEAEKAGKAFIAFKWFRDEALPKYNFDWTTSPESRQAVLAKAIESGAIQTSRIPNPKAPQHPTTTVALNRVDTPQGVTPRFKPIVVRGEPVTVSMMRDRGNT